MIFCHPCKKYFAKKTKNLLQGWQQWWNFVSTTAKLRKKFTEMLQAKHQISKFKGACIGPTCLPSDAFKIISQKMLAKGIYVHNKWRISFPSVTTAIKYYITRCWHSISRGKILASPILSHCEWCHKQISNHHFINRTTQTQNELKTQAILDTSILRVKHCTLGWPTRQWKPASHCL